jgi:acetyl-CoA acetyltransferase
MNPWRQVAIAGVYTTKQARVLDGETSTSATLESIRGALADAGLSIDDVDGVNMCIGHPARISRSRTFMASSRLCGGRPHWVGMKFVGGSALLEAAAAIATGNCSVAVVAAGQAQEHRSHESTAPWTRPANPFFECWGLHTAVEFALVARQHMARYGTTAEQIAGVAATIRNHGSINPDAVFYGKGPFTAQDVLASRVIAEPVHLLDCAMTSEGGAAFVLCAADRAADLASPPIYLHGGALERMAPSFGLSRPPILDDVGMVGQWAAQKAFGQAGYGPETVDVCEFYDPVSFEVLRQFEAYGFCDPGEGGDFVADGRIGLGGDLPSVTDGGRLSHGHPGIPATYLPLIESVRQLRGRSGERQVEGASVAMATGGGAGHLWNDVLLLGRDPL